MARLAEHGSFWVRTQSGQVRREKQKLYDTVLIREQTQARLRGEESEAESGMETAAYERQASGLDALNKICADLGLVPFADIDTRDREAVAAWIGQCRRELYNRGIGKGHTGCFNN